MTDNCQMTAEIAPVSCRSCGKEMDGIRDVYACTQCPCPMLRLEIEQMARTSRAELAAEVIKLRSALYLAWDCYGESGDLTAKEMVWRLETRRALKMAAR